MINRLAFAIHGEDRFDRTTACEAAPHAASVEERCLRCARTSLLIVGDGPAVCRVCAMAWGALAAAITSGDVVPEPDRLALAHRDHWAPRLGCVWCQGEVRWKASMVGRERRGDRRPF